MPHNLEFADWVPFPLPRVFAFFANPENLPRLMPAATNTRIDRLDLLPPPNDIASAVKNQQLEIACAGPGTIVTTSFRLFPFLPLRAQWVARITEFEWDYYFADIQEKGPFKRWHHRHEFQAESRNGVNGTLVRDVIDYEVGFGAAGMLADALFVARHMRHTFAQRQQILPGLISETRVS